MFDGESAGSTLLGKFCGNTIPGLITSTSDKVRVNFVSDSSLTGRGFRLEYMTGGEHCCIFVTGKLANGKLWLFSVSYKLWSVLSFGLDVCVSQRCQWCTLVHLDYACSSAS